MLHSSKWSGQPGLKKENRLMAKVGSNPRLSQKQQAFVDEFIIDRNATQAAIRAGYSEKTAQEQSSQLLSKLIIQDAVNERLKEREKRTEITVDYILTNLKSIVERCLQVEAVLDKQGNLTGEYRFDASGANKALELLGKHLKLFTDRLEIRVISSVDDLSDEEQQSLLADLEARQGVKG